MLAAGCSSDDDATRAGAPEQPSAPAGGAALSAAPGWAARADGFCATLLARFERALHPTYPDRYQHGIEEAIRLGRADLGAFEDAGARAERRYPAHVVGAALAVHLVALAELAEAAEDGNEGRARVALERAADARRRAAPFARKLGLEACAAAASR